MNLSTRLFGLAVAFAAALTLLQVSPAMAAEPLTKPGDQDFLAGTKTLSAYVGYNREFSSDPQIGYGAIGVGYFPFNYFSVNAEARLLGSSQEGEDATVVALDLSIRHHLIRGEGWSLFVDASAAISESTVRIPQGGTHFNFMEEVGIGGTIKLQDHLHLIGGVRYWHLSNARLHGGDENPGLNGVGGYLGLMWTF